MHFHQFLPFNYANIAKTHYKMVKNPISSAIHLKMGFSTTFYHQTDYSTKCRPVNGAFGKIVLWLKDLRVFHEVISKNTNS
jgi:hypothetical protein